MEDLIASARDRGGCAYFAARARAPTASIVFLPYAYLVSPGVRKAMDVSLQQAVVVVDEAHNLESVCREAARYGARANARVCAMDVRGDVIMFAGVGMLGCWDERGGVDGMRGRNGAVGARGCRVNFSRAHVSARLQRNRLSRGQF